MKYFFYNVLIWFFQYYFFNYLVTIPWQSVLPNLPKVTQTISKILKNLPDFLSNSGPHIISGKYIQVCILTTYMQKTTTNFYKRLLDFYLNFFN